MISTTKDLQTFISALNSGKLLPARLLTEMRKTDPNSEGLYGRYGLGMYVKDTGPNCAGLLMNHNGSVIGYGALMYSTPDGSKTLTASITSGDSPTDPIAQFPTLLTTLITQTFCPA